MDMSTQQLLNLRLRNLFRRWGGKIVTGEELAMRVCPRKVRSYTHEISLAWLLKNDLNKSNMLTGTRDSSPNLSLIQRIIGN